MKNVYLLSLLLLFGNGLCAQPNRLYPLQTDSGAVNVDQPNNPGRFAQHDTLRRSADSRAEGEAAPKTLTLEQLPGLVPALSRVQTPLIAVRKGDSVRTELFTRYNLKRDLKTTLRQSLEMGTLAYLANQPLPLTAIPEARPSVDQRNRLNMGVGIMLPLSQLLRIDKKPDAWLQYEIYSQDTVLVATRKAPISRRARKRWWLSEIASRVPENGFIRISYINHSRRPIWLSGLSIESVRTEDSVKGARSAADSSVVDSLDAPPAKPAGSIADELGLQSGGECQPNPGCNVCNPASDCYDPCICQPGSCLPPVDCNRCDPSSGCYDRCACNPADCTPPNPCQTNPYSCECNPAICNPCLLNPNSCECNPANCNPPNPCQTNPNSCACGNYAAANPCECSGVGCNPPNPPSENDQAIAILQQEGFANSCEINYMINHAIHAPSVLANRRTVEAFIRDNFRAGNDNGDSPENAIKHALYQAINVCSIGADDTRALAQLHEECDGRRFGTNQSFNMDTHNNNVGIAIGQNWQANGCNLSNLAAAVIEAFQQGRLIKIDGTPTP
ncbi:DUF6973 domain-containing protein [Spirosoma soli]|uniref:DUF6973 domain-containing protein n=1 Tax=Spirosoma soli TaxID=1770529 RepID=A0ABW5M066_9BACT